MDNASESNTKLNTDDIVRVMDIEKLNSHLKTSLTKIIYDEGFLTFQLETNVLQRNVNYMGELCEVQITGNTEKGYKEIDLFTKSNLRVNSDTDYISINEVYLREIFFYSKLSAVFEELQAKPNIPKGERYNVVKFYDTGNENALIMENMRVKGYQVPERLELPTLSFSEVAMKELAKFHALSFVIKKQMPEFFETEIKSMKVVIDFNESWQACVEHLTKNALNSIQSEEAKAKLRKYATIDNIVSKFEYYLKAEDINIGVFCHGDYRTQNILMREKDGMILDVLPIDYQTTYYGHPINDVVYYIAGATDHQSRKKHMDHLKNIYYDALKDYLPYFDMDVRDIYPREHFEIDFKERLDYGIIVGINYFPFLFAPEDDIPDLNTELNTRKLAQSDFYVKCINELIEDFVDWGYL